MHIIRNKKKLLQRVRRIRGQVEAVERTLEAEDEAAPILQQIAATRGALNGLMAELLDGHVREHVLDPAREATSDQLEATDQLLRAIRSYLR